MGRPKLDIDVKQVETLASLGCSGEEIASVVGCSRATLYRCFKTAINSGHNLQKVSLRKAQHDAAKKGNAALLIWLGKQYLGQKERPGENEVMIPAGSQVSIIVEGKPLVEPKPESPEPTPENENPAK